MMHVYRLQQRLRRRGRTREDAEDLTQEAILRVLEYCLRGGEVRQAEAVLARTTQNLSCNDHRDSRRNLFVKEDIGDLQLPSSAPLPEDIIEADQCLERMLRALSASNERTRDVFLLHRVGGWNYSQIAQRYGISESAVEKQIAKASLMLMDAARAGEPQ